MAIRLCRACKDFHDLDQPWPVKCYGHFASNGNGSSLQIIKDIDPYKAVAVDKRTGKAPVINSRSAHREFLKANRYVEVGNEPIRKPPEVDIPSSHHEIKQTLDQFRSEGRWK